MVALMQTVASEYKKKNTDTNVLLVLEKVWDSQSVRSKHWIKARRKFNQNILPDLRCVFITFVSYILFFLLTWRETWEQWRFNTETNILTSAATLSKLWQYSSAQLWESIYSFCCQDPN